MSFPVALQLAGRKCLVVGTGDEARVRTEQLHAAGARVIWVTRNQQDAAGSARGEGNELCQLEEREFADHDVRECWLVVLTERDRTLASRLQHLCEQQQTFFCAVDQPEFNSFAHMALVNAAPLRVAISTEGQVPALARRLREELQRVFDEGKLAEFARSLAAWRERLPKHERAARLAAVLREFRFEGRLVVPPHSNSGKPSSGSGAG